MKRYMLFVYSYYYPSGGMNDFLGAFDSVDDAKTFLKSAYKDKDDEIQIYDVESGETVIDGAWSEVMG